MCRWLMAAVLGCSAGMALSRDAHAQAACPVAALSAYSHNDYERPHPLEDALALGFRGVEVDLFLVDGELRIGHDRRAARSGGTLDSVYLAPLAALVDRCGPWGRWWIVRFCWHFRDQEQSPATYDALMAVLRRYRHLWVRDEAGGTRVALDVVLVGWHPPPMAHAWIRCRAFSIGCRALSQWTRPFLTRVCGCSAWTTENHGTMVAPVNHTSPMVRRDTREQGRCAGSFAARAQCAAECRCVCGTVRGWRGFDWHQTT